MGADPGGGPLGAEPGGGALLPGPGPAWSGPPAPEPGAGPLAPSGGPVFAGGGCPPPPPPGLGAGPPRLGAEPPWAPGPWAGDESEGPPGLLGAAFDEPPPGPLEPSSNPPKPPPPRRRSRRCCPHWNRRSTTSRRRWRCRHRHRRRWSCCRPPPPPELLPPPPPPPPPPAVSNDVENPESKGASGWGSALATPALDPRRVRPRQPAAAKHANCWVLESRFLAEAVLLGCRRGCMFATLSALSAMHLGRRCRARIDARRCRPRFGLRRRGTRCGDSANGLPAVPVLQRYRLRCPLNGRRACMPGSEYGQTARRARGSSKSVAGESMCLPWL